MEIRHLPAKEYVINHSFYSKELMKKKKKELMNGNNKKKELMNIVIISIKRENTRKG